MWGGGCVGWWLCGVVVVWGGGFVGWRLCGVVVRIDGLVVWNGCVVDCI